MNNESTTSYKGKLGCLQGHACHFEQYIPMLFLLRKTLEYLRNDDQLEGKLS